MNEDTLRWLKRLRATQDAGGLQDTFGRTCARLYAMGVQDDEIRKVLNDGILDHEKEMILGNRSPLAVPHLRGSLPLGFDETGCPVHIPRSTLVRHLLLVAATGAGKSNLIFSVVASLLGEVGLWLVDNAGKQELRRLLGLANELSVPMTVVPLRMARFNPLELDSLDEQRFITRRSASIATTLGLPPRGRSIFIRAVRAAYRERGVSGPNTPVLRDVLELVRRDRTHPGAKEAVVERLEGVLAELGPALCWRQGWRPSQLSRHAMVLESGGASERATRLIVNYCLESIYLRSTDAGGSNQPLKHVVVLDDSQSLMSDRLDGETSVLEQLAGVIRTSGTGLLLATQDAHGLSPGLIANMGTVILGRSSGQDVANVGRAIGLDAPSIQWSRVHCDRGTFIARVADPDWHRPWVLRTDRFELPTVSKGEVEATLANLDGLPTTNATRPTRPKTNGNGTKPHALPADAVTLMAAIHRHPATPISKLIACSGLPKGRFYAARKALTDQQLIQEMQISLSPRGRPATILELTRAGEKALSGSPA